MCDRGTKERPCKFTHRKCSNIKEFKEIVKPKSAPPTPANSVPVSRAQSNDSRAQAKAKGKAKAKAKANVAETTTTTMPPNDNTHVCPLGTDCGGFWNHDCKRIHYKIGNDGVQLSAEKDRFSGRRRGSPAPNKRKNE